MKKIHIADLFSFFIFVCINNIIIYAGELLLGYEDSFRPHLKGTFCRITDYFASAFLFWFYFGIKALLFSMLVVYKRKPIIQQVLSSFFLFDLYFLGIKILDYIFNTSLESYYMSNYQIIADKLLFIPNFLPSLFWAVLIGFWMWRVKIYSVKEFLLKISLNGASLILYALFLLGFALM